MNQDPKNKAPTKSLLQSRKSATSGPKPKKPTLLQRLTGNRQRTQAIDAENARLKEFLRAKGFDPEDLKAPSTSPSPKSSNVGITPTPPSDLQSTPTIKNSHADLWDETSLEKKVRLQAIALQEQKAAQIQQEDPREDAAGVSTDTGKSSDQSPTQTDGKGKSETLSGRDRLQAAWGAAHPEVFGSRK